MKDEYSKIINENDKVVLIEEGLGSYHGTPTDKILHPYGRMGAMVSCYVNGKLVYRTKNASTLPDSISDECAYKYNDGTPIPISCEGVYPIYTKMHNGKYKAFELEKGSKTIPVIRKDTLSESSYINFHYRKENDYSSYASSTGCFTVLSNDLNKLFVAMGIFSFNGEYVGKIIVDRSNISKELYQLYKKEMPNMIDLIATENELTADEIIAKGFSEPDGWIEYCNKLEELGIVLEELSLGKYIRTAFKKIYYLDR